MAEHSGGPRTGRSRLVLLAMIAFAPILIAYVVFFYFPGWIPSATTNQGELIIPPAPGQDISTELGQYTSWVLMQPAALDCDEKCARMLYLSRQVVIGLGKNAGRVKRALLAPVGVSAAFRDFLRREHSDVRIIEAVRNLPGKASDEEPLLFLMDPGGQVMMYYSLEKAGKPMLKDLKHLLKAADMS